MLNKAFPVLVMYLHQCVVPASDTFCRVSLSSFAGYSVIL